MKTPTLISLAMIFTNVTTALAGSDICKSVYGKHKLFHHVKNWIGPNKFSEPMLVEVEIKKDGSLISQYHFDDHVETAIFSKNFPQLLFFHQRGSWQLGCVNQEPECARLREDVRDYNIDSLIYLDIENENDLKTKPKVAIRRKKVLACAAQMRKNIIQSTFL